MKQKNEEYYADLNHLSSSCKSIFLLGGISSIILIVYSLATILIMVFIGPPPETITECFTILNQNRFFGLLRLDILTVFIMPLYYLLFFSIYKALKKPNTSEIVTIITILIFAGLTLFLATPSVFSYLDLSQKYAIATSEIQRNQLLSAGEAILASDMWHGTGAKIGGMLLQTGALLISVVMLKQNVFNNLTAYTGIFTHGLDLAHILIGFFLPAVGNTIMAIAGPLYLLWFLLVGIRLINLGTYCQRIER
jgi:hypothetical protein